MMNLDDYKLVVCDMDGTLLNDEKELSSEVSWIKEKLRSKGIDFTLASGRNIHILENYIQQIKIEVPVICNNGANIFYHSKCLHQQNINMDDLESATKVLEENNIGYIAYANDEVFVRKTNPIIPFIKRLEGKVDITYTTTFVRPKKAILKLVCIDEDDNKMKRIQKELEFICKESILLKSEGSIYTFSDRLATKGEAIHRLCNYLNIKEEQVLVFGDNYNDISMFEVAGYGVAVENAEPALKEVAKAFCGSNRNNGVIEYLKQFI